VGFILWLAAVVIVVWGIVSLLSGHISWGVLLIVLGCAVGPGGWSIWGRRSPT
jgi:hypothetical protein